MTQQSRAEAAAEAAASTDAAVIQLSRHEPEHFTVLFRRHAPYIQRYVVRRLGPDAAARDDGASPVTDAGGNAASKTRSPSYARSCKSSSRFTTC